jgi:hypothetical protein
MTGDLAVFRKTGALLDGHFVLPCGPHSREYFQCALLLQHTAIAKKVCGWLAGKLRAFRWDRSTAAVFHRVSSHIVSRSRFALKHCEIAPASYTDANFPA